MEANGIVGSRYAIKLRGDFGKQLHAIGVVEGSEHMIIPRSLCFHLRTFWKVVDNKHAHEAIFLRVLLQVQLWAQIYAGPAGVSLPSLCYSTRCHCVVSHGHRLSRSNCHTTRCEESSENSDLRPPLVHKLFDRSHDMERESAALPVG